MANGGFILLTIFFHKEEDGRWTAECKELGTSTFGDSLEEARELISEAVCLHLNTLEEVGERSRFFKENNIRIFRKRPPKSIDVSSPVDPNVYISTQAQPLQFATAYR